MQVLSRYTILFLIYSFLGAFAETLFRLITDHHLYGVNGFLHLPILPIYGLGALLVVLLFGQRVRNPVLLFFLSALVTTILEYAGHLLIELIFNTRIWDYSSEPFNLNGRISLASSIGFGLASVFLVYIIHPATWGAVKHIPSAVAIVAAALVWVVLIADIISSTIMRLS